MLFGIMQGRLSKSRTGVLQYLPKKWKLEFIRLKKTKLDYIELFTTKIYDNSPIWNKNDLILKKKILQTKLKKIILCDNYAFKKSLTSNKYKNYFNKLTDKLSMFQKKKLP